MQNVFKFLCLTGVFMKPVSFGTQAPNWLEFSLHVHCHVDSQKGSGAVFNSSDRVI